MVENLEPRRLLSDVIPVGPEFLVNAYSTNGHSDPTIAMDSAGEFVVAWSSPQDGSGSGIYAQRYNAAGVPQGGEFRVNTYTTGNQWTPSVAIDADGDFVVAWTDQSQDGTPYSVYAQRYNAAGVTQARSSRSTPTPRIDSFTPRSRWTRPATSW